MKEQEQVFLIMPIFQVQVSSYDRRWQYFQVPGHILLLGILFFSANITEENREKLSSKAQTLNLRIYPNLIQF